MQVGFRAFAVTAAAVCFALALVWLAAPQLLLMLWGVSANEPAELLGRRSAALFTGVGVMFFAARNAGPSPARQALLLGFAVACVALAALGLFEWAARRVHAGILVAVVTELALALLCRRAMHEAPAGRTDAGTRPGDGRAATPPPRRP